MGALRVGNLAEQLENAGNDSNIAFIKENSDNFISQCSKICSDINAILSPDDAPKSKSVIPEDKLIDAYQAINEVAR